MNGGNTNSVDNFGKDCANKFYTKVTQIGRINQENIGLFPSLPRSSRLFLSNGKNGLPTITGFEDSQPFTSNQSQILCNYSAFEPFINAFNFGIFPLSLNLAPSELPFIQEPG